MELCPKPQISLFQDIQWYTVIPSTQESWNHGKDDSEGFLIPVDTTEQKSYCHGSFYVTTWLDYYNWSTLSKDDPTILWVGFAQSAEGLGAKLEGADFS